MDHEAYESQMIEGINHNADEKSQHISTNESSTTTKKSVFTKEDAKALRRGVKRTLLALLTAIAFGLSVSSFIAVASATGYWAVVLFLSAIVLMVFAFILLYAQGITFFERRGDAHE